MTLAKTDDCSEHWQQLVAEGHPVMLLSKVHVSSACPSLHREPGCMEGSWNKAHRHNCRTPYSVLTWALRVLLHSVLPVLYW